MPSPRTRLKSPTAVSEPVRILLDQNLSPKLIRSLANVLPALESVYEHGLVGATDPYIFDWARRMEFSALVSADRDLVHLVERVGPPPKVIRIERCDYRSVVIEQLFRREALRIHEFLESDRAVLLLKL
jgi:predicted nuclease of predicted toxin-antitoxin system